jgi:hypothetical protein
LKSKQTLLIKAIILLFFSSGPSYSQLLFKLESDSLLQFDYYSGDEFNNAELNSEFWKGPWTRVNMAQNFRYNNDNIKFENGLVDFLMLKRDSVYKINPHEIDSTFLKEKKRAIQNFTFSLGYSAGMIISQKKFHYGLYELKFKVEEGKGVWPAFWFFGGEKNEEIDAFELKGERTNSIHVDTHCPEGCDKGYKNKLGFNTNFGGWLPTKNYLHNGYNVFVLEWKPDEVIWYLNGFPIAYFKGRFSNPMNVFLNTQIAADGRAFKPGPDEGTKFPNHFLVDYLRIWKQAPVENNPILKMNASMSDDTLRYINYVNKPDSKRGLMYNKKRFAEESGTMTMVLLTGNRVRVCVTGRLKEEGLISFEGDGTVFSYPTNVSEFEFQVPKNLERLTLNIQFEKKVYSKSIMISN